MRKFINAVFVPAIILLSGLVSAAEYPERPVRVIVPSAPGSGPDVSARVVTAELSQQMGRQFVVDNRPGGSFLIGFEIITRAAPDGYTIGYGTSGALAMTPGIAPGWPYDLGRDYQPVVLLHVSTFILAVASSLPVKSVTELIAHARKTPGKLLVVGQAVGSAQHLAGALFQQMTGTQMPVIQSKSPQQGITDMIGGQVHLMFDGANSIGAYVRTGRVRGLAVTTAKRSALFPELPTIAESGVPGYVVTTWSGLIAPSRVSSAILTKLNTESNKALASAAVKEKFGALGNEPMGGTAEAFVVLIKSDMARWAAVIKEAGIKPY
jgi:tripartite-type tricarboxylate transporter receptor subunit TctC